jgi:DNA-binding YbaB/EbfC family protein
MKNIGQLLKQAQKMQGAMKKIQEELSQKQISASSGGGVVEVIANGKQQIVEIKINPEVVNPDEIELLEDLLMAAVNEALGQAGELAASEMKKVTGGFDLPGLF